MEDLVCACRTKVTLQNTDQVFCIIASPAPHKVPTLSQWWEPVAITTLFHQIKKSKHCHPELPSLVW